MRTPANRLLPGQIIRFDGIICRVRAIEPHLEPGFVWITDHDNRHHRLTSRELVATGRSAL